MSPDMEEELMEVVKNFSEAEFVKRVRRHFVVRDLDMPNPKFMCVGKVKNCIMLDDFSGIKIAYDACIDRDASWDDAIAERGINVFAYDLAPNALPEMNPRIRRFKNGLTGKLDPAHPDLETLPRLIEQNGHSNENNMLLKMDIEGAEYSVLQSIDAKTLKRFKQIVVEFHGLIYADLENVIGISIDKLNATHQLVHVHGNNGGKFIMRGGLLLPEMLECTYLRRSDYKFVESTRFFPTPLDKPNRPHRPEINLGYWGRT